MEHEVHILSGKVSCDHAHRFVSYKAQMPVRKLVQYLQGPRSRNLLAEIAHFRKQFWGRQFGARGYLAISSGSITNELVEQYISEK